jgi:hypothetical protein
MIKKILKSVPSFVLFVALAVVYLGAGYFLGYHEGYKAGQEDYIEYLNKIFEGLKMTDFDALEKEQPKAPPKVEVPKK